MHNQLEVPSPFKKGGKLEYARIFENFKLYFILGSQVLEH